MIPANEVIKKRRLELNLTQADMCRLTGLETMEYWDVEQHHDEFYTLISLKTAKQICHILKLDILDLIDGRFQSIDQPLPRNDLIRTKREKLGMSQEQLADAIGFETVTIEESEKHPGYIDTLPIFVLSDLARVLGINPCALI